MKKIWSINRRISGKPTTTPTNHLIVNGTTIEQPTDIANFLASTISHNSSSDHYTEKFQRFEAHQEKRTIKFTSNNQKSYNAPFSMTELQTALHKAHDSAASPDNIHYQVLKHSPGAAKARYFESSTTCGSLGNSPKIWSETTIIPISKPGKDPTSPSNYRPDCFNQLRV